MASQRRYACDRTTVFGQQQVLPMQTVGELVPGTHVAVTVTIVHVSVTRR